jgi:hypothetical protein
MSGDGSVHRSKYKGWWVALELDRSTAEGVFTGHGDLRWKSQHRCRIVLVGKYRDGASTVAALLQKARAFIDERDIQRGARAMPFIEQ